MAPGLTVAAFGAAAGAPTALIFCFDMAMLIVLTPLMMALGGTERWQPELIVKGIVRQLGLHPLVIATALGFAVSALRIAPPAPVDSLVNLLASAAAPAALFLVGVSLSMRSFDRISIELTALIATKLAIHPLVVYLLLSWVGGFDRVWVNTAVLMAALPAAANVIVIARRYDTFVAGATTAVLVSTGLSVASLTVLLILLLNDILPVDPFI
jgi:predicted permease